MKPDILGWILEQQKIFKAGISGKISEIQIKVPSLVNRILPNVKFLVLVLITMSGL